MSGTPDVAVIGGGMIGLAVAREAQARGIDVVVLDAGEPGAWHVAAGMLAPVTETDFGEDALTRLGLESAARYPAFCDGLGVELREQGTLVVARDADDAAVLDRLYALQQQLGLASERLRPTAARRAEGALAPSVRLALDVPGDRSVDPRALHAALTTDLHIQRTHVTDLAEVRAGQVVVAMGAHSPAPVRPVKGQVLRLKDPRGPGLVERTIRTTDCYLVPRADGSYVLGATMEERGWDASPTAGGVHDLLRSMSEVLPGVLELDLTDVLVGFRPGTPDNVPLIGRHEGRILATGHWRNGILLAPVTAELVADLLTGGELPDWATPCDPARFAKVTA